MRDFFWHIIITLGVFALIVFIFLIASLRFSNNITFTDDDAATGPSVTIVDPQIGGENAKVTIVNFGDYSCPSCATLDGDLASLLKKYPDDLKVVWKDMPNEQRHPEAIPAAIAARCAGEQDKFWEFHTVLMNNQTELSESLYVQTAGSFGLNVNTFMRCFEDEETKPLVERGFNEGLELAITTTPTIWINNERYTGILTASELEKVVKAALLTQK